MLKRLPPVESRTMGSKTMNNKGFTSWNVEFFSIRRYPKLTIGVHIPVDFSQSRRFINFFMN
jgi:hypothetical protein